jgi:hypothetical protein
MTKDPAQIAESRRVYLALREDGQSVEEAAKASGISVASAVRWEENIAQRRERLGMAADRTAGKLIAAANRGDARAVAAVMEPLDLERTRAVAVAAAVRAVGGAHECLCGHLDLFHRISDSSGERTGCDWNEPAAGGLCDCKRFKEAP